MEFDAENKVIINSMNQAEAWAFIKFLQSEIIRHRRDIKEAYRLITEVGAMYDINVFTD